MYLRILCHMYVVMPNINLSKLITSSKLIAFKLLHVVCHSKHFNLNFGHILHDHFYVGVFIKGLYEC